MLHQHIYNLWRYVSTWAPCSNNSLSQRYTSPFIVMSASYKDKNYTKSCKYCSDPLSSCRNRQWWPNLHHNACSAEICQTDPCITPEVNVDWELTTDYVEKLWVCSPSTIWDWTPPDSSWRPTPLAPLWSVHLSHGIAYYAADSCWKLLPGQ